MGKGTAAAVGGIVIVGGGVGLAYKGFKKLKNALSESPGQSSYPTLKEHPRLSAAVTSSPYQQPGLHRQVYNQPTYQSTYQTQPLTYRDRLAASTYNALDAGDIDTANKRFEYLIRADGNDF